MVYVRGKIIGLELYKVVPKLYIQLFFVNFIVYGRIYISNIIAFSELDIRVLYD
jgi:hypothetical protein